MLYHEISEVVEKLCTLGSWSVQTPYGFESLVGDLDCGVDVFTSGFCNFGDDLSVGYTSPSVQGR